MWWFIVIWSVLLILIYLYIGFRLIKPANLSANQNRIAWILLFLIPLSQPVALILRQVSAAGIIKDSIGWLSYTGFGFFSLILAGLILRDIILLVNFICRKTKTGLEKLRGRRTEDSLPYNPERRLFLLNATNMGILGASALMTGYGFYEARRKALLEKVTIPIYNLPTNFNGFTIAQFTDIHVGPTIKRHFVQSVVDQVNELNADIIVYTGDLVDGTVPDLRDDVEPLKDLHARDGVYFVTGNHEYYSGAESWLEEVDRLGLTILQNTHQIIQKGINSLVLAGVPDYAAGNFIPSHKSNPATALKGAKASDVKILLAHQPKSIFEAEKAGYDLQISGHTHGGQYIPSISDC